MMYFLVTMTLSQLKGMFGFLTPPFTDVTRTIAQREMHVLTLNTSLYWCNYDYEYGTMQNYVKVLDNSLY